MCLFVIEQITRIIVLTFHVVPKEEGNFSFGQVNNLETLLGMKHEC